MYSGPAVLTPWLFPVLLALLHPHSWRQSRERRGQEGTCPGFALHHQSLHKKELSPFIPIPVPPPSGIFSLNTHLTFSKFLHFSGTRPSPKRWYPSFSRTSPMRGLSPSARGGPNGANRSSWPQRCQQRVLALCTGKVTAGTALGSLGNHPSGC